MDSMCHCLERAGVVKDDSLLINWNWIFMGLDRKNPKAEIVITELEARP
jgi:Holliday junction resolvase RusA-like endonuclease